MWAIIIAGPTAIAATTCVVLDGGQAGDVSGEAQVLRFGDEPVMVPIRHLASTIPADREGMADINAWYSRLLAVDEARDAAALAAVAWQMYGQLATTAADLGALRARFRVYAAAPRAGGRRRPAPRGAQVGDRAAAA